MEPFYLELQTIGIDLTTIQIDGERISLLPINESYASEIFKEFDSEITRYMPPKPAEHIDETLTFIQSSLDGMRDASELVLVIIKRDDGEFFRLENTQRILGKRICY